MCLKNDAQVRSKNINNIKHTYARAAGLAHTHCPSKSHIFAHTLENSPFNAATPKMFFTSKMNG
jgi:hypothetical protein